MNMIFTLTLRNLLSNKKRTLLTLLTILLSISMITAILCGGWSLVDFLKEKEKVYGGDYDYYMEDLTWEQAQELYSQNNVGVRFRFSALPETVFTGRNPTVQCFPLARLTRTLPKDFR